MNFGTNLFVIPYVIFHQLYIFPLLPKKTTHYYTNYATTSSADKWEFAENNNLIYKF